MWNKSPVQVDAWYRMLGAGALGWPRGMVWGERWEGGSGWGTHVHCGRFMLMYGKTNTILWSNKPPIKINKFILKKRRWPWRARPGWGASKPRWRAGRRVERQGGLRRLFKYWTENETESQNFWLQQFSGCHCHEAKTWNMSTMIKEWGWTGLGARRIVEV